MLKFKQFIAPCIFFSISAGAAAQTHQVHNAPAAAQETAGAVQHFSAVTAAKAKAPNPSAELEIATAKRAAEADAAKKAEAKKIASSSQREIQQKIFRSWQVPEGSAGLDARARIALTDTGNVQSIVVMDAPNAAFKNSIEKAVRQAAPFAMPEDRDARRAARLIHIRFAAK